MAQRLEALTVLPEALSSIPSWGTKLMVELLPGAFKSLYSTAGFGGTGTSWVW